MATARSDSRQAVSVAPTTRAIGLGDTSWNSVRA